MVPIYGKHRICIIKEPQHTIYITKDPPMKFTFAVTLLYFLITIGLLLDNKDFAAFCMSFVTMFLLYTTLRMLLDD